MEIDLVMSYLGKHKFHHIFILIAIIIALFSFYYRAWLIGQDREKNYNQAIQQMQAGNYQSALTLFEQIEEFKDSPKYIEYLDALLLFDGEQYEEAIAKFHQLGGFLESENYILKAKKYLRDMEIKYQFNNTLYNSAYKLYLDKEYYSAYKIFESLGDFKDSNRISEECHDKLNMLKYATTISAGISSSAGVTSTGKVFLSGKKVLLPSDVSDWTDIISVSTMGSLVIGLKMDGTVITAGSLDNNKYYRIETSNWDDIIAVSAGDLYVLGLRKDGTIVAQGYNNYGQMDVDNWRDITTISTGWRLTAGLDSAGSIHVTGRYSEEIVEEIENSKDNWKNLVAVSAGGGKTNVAGEFGHVVALKANHTVVAAGDNGRGQCNVTGADWSDIVAISAGAYHTVGLKADGTVVTTQTAPEIVKEIEKWNEAKDIVAISAGYGFTLALRANGQVVGCGFFYDNIRDTDNWEDIVYYTQEWNSIFNMKATD